LIVSAGRPISSLRFRLAAAETACRVYVATKRINKEIPLNRKF
jgi:hypothetical protein